MRNNERRVTSLKRLKGLKRDKQTLASGEVVTYISFRATKRALPGAEGSTEFMVAYFEECAKVEAAKLAKANANTGMFRDLIALYKTSDEYTTLGARTKKDYNRYIKMIEAEFGDMPIQPIKDTPEEVRGDFKTWRDGLVAKKRTADMAWSVLARICSVATDRGKLRVNPCLKGGRLYESDRTEKLWRAPHFERLFAKASSEVCDVVVLGLYTGLREGKCLSLPKSAYRDGYLHIPRKRGTKNHTPIRIKVMPGTQLWQLLQRVDWENTEITTILTNTRDQSWTEDGFRTSFGKACKAAKIGSEFGEDNDLHFHDLRGTAVTLLALAGCEVAEIASITGHSLKTVQEILDQHYLGDRAKLADQAMEKLFAANSSLLLLPEVKIS